MLGSFRAFTALATVASILVSRVDAIAKISRSGRYLYQDDGTRFYIKGIAYQEQGMPCFLADLWPLNSWAQVLLLRALTTHSESRRPSSTHWLCRMPVGVTCPSYNNWASTQSGSTA